MIIKFYTPGCAPCRAITDILNQMEVEYVGIDISKNVMLAVEHQVMTVPTLINVEAKSRLVGFHGIFKTQEWLNDNTD